MRKIAIVGEAYGEEEARQCLPFVGYSGQALTSMLSEAGISRADCLVTNVFQIHPPGNDLSFFCGPKAEAIPGYPPMGGKYVRAEFTQELNRLRGEIERAKPNLILALGNTASWAFLGRGLVSKYRGTTETSTLTSPGIKVLQTYHPAAVTRQWDLRPIVIIDFMKARREAEYPELRRPHREIWIEPTLEDLDDFYARHIRVPGPLSVDIETAGSVITCVGFAPNPGVGIVIPFLDGRRKDRHYWPTLSDERAAWKFIRDIMAEPHLAKTFQNGLYDISFLWRAYGVKTFGAAHDTMLLHHALQPESLKSLGFLGSVYTDEGAWKQMRERSTTIKRDE